MPGAEYNLYISQRVIRFVKDKFSYKCLLVATAKEQQRLFNSCRPV